MVKRKPCPIPGCNEKWTSENGLWGHLYYKHLKNELIKWVIGHVEK